MTGDNLLDQFVAFSATATAFSAVDLWGTGMAKAYLATVIDEAGPDILRELLDAWAAASGEPDQAPFGEIFTSEKLGPLARNIVKLWYSGIWYETPAHWVARFGLPVKAVPTQRRAAQRGHQPGPARTAPFVVSPAAYTEGLLWRAVGAHPAGAKAPGYGSWAEPPVIEGYEPGPVKGEAR